MYDLCLSRTISAGVAIATHPPTHPTATLRQRVLFENFAQIRNEKLVRLNFKLSLLYSDVMDLVGFNALERFNFFFFCSKMTFAQNGHVKCKGAYLMFRKY